MAPSSALDLGHWYPLAPQWEGSAPDTLDGGPGHLLSPAWRLLVLGDGSPTRHLQLLTGQPTQVDLIDMRPIGHSRDGASALLEAIPGPRLRRQVWLRGGQERLAYACSWWPTDRVDDLLEDRRQPIWASLSQHRLELYRDLRWVCHGDSPALEVAFGQPGPFWGRYYYFWHQGQPLTLIYEVFSPLLDRYLQSPTI